MPSFRRRQETDLRETHDHWKGVPTASLRPIAKTWMVLSTGVAHAVDCDCRIVLTRLVKPIQRELEAGLQQTSEALVGGRVTELAWKRTNMPTRSGLTQGRPSGRRACCDKLATYHAHRLIANAGGDADMERSTTMCKSQRKPSKR